VFNLLARFICMTLPGRSNLQVTFWLWLYVLMGGILACAIGEQQALQSAAGTAMVIGGVWLAAAAWLDLS